MFGTLGGPELILILVVALIVFGPRKLPEMGKSLGKMMLEFRRASNDFRRTIEDEVETEKLREATRIPALDVPAPAATPVAGAVAAPDAVAPPSSPPGTLTQGAPAASAASDAPADAASSGAATPEPSAEGQR
ncbi:MAG: twin-arginine translocase TatA/TatE family subunit [Vicinamibacteria bacterium]